MHHPGMKPHDVTDIDSETGSRGHPDGLAQADRRRTVLIVEDDPDLLEVMCFALECEGFRVEAARNGVEALAMLRAGRVPRLVLLDLMMPVMDGRTFLGELAKIPELGALPVVVLTAGGPMKVPEAVAVLPKPIDLELLIEAVAHHAGGGE
jgi:two-component system, chemotaxis family, chemotaxis protein CheY